VRKTEAIIAAGVTVATVCLTACSEGESAGTSPTPSPTTSSSDTAAPTGQAAPTVSHPLEVSSYAADPCTSLTAQQAAELEIGPQGQELHLTSGELGCSWKFGTNRGSEAQIIYSVPESGKGLQHLYDLNATGWFARGYFEPTVVDEYPAAFNSTSETRSQGVCFLTVGVSSDTLLNAQVIGEAGKDNCKAASTVAARALDTIKAGA